MMMHILAFLLFITLTCRSAVAVVYTPIGCYKDPLEEPRPLPELIENYRNGRVNWTNLNQTIGACAEAARMKKYLYFGLQFYGECWSGPQAQSSYSRNGSSNNCDKGVGKERANFVYKLPEECVNYRVLKSADRSMANENKQRFKCDHWNFGFVEDVWYRFTGAAGKTMPDKCVSAGKCQTIMSGWMDGKHPQVDDGIQKRKACFSAENNCCKRQTDIHVRNCGEFYVYKLPSTPGCYLRYCGSGVSENMNA